MHRDGNAFDLWTNGFLRAFRGSISRIPVVDETLGQISQEPAVAFRFAQEDASSAGEVTTSKIDLHFSGAEVLKKETDLPGS